MTNKLITNKPITTTLNLILISISPLSFSTYDYPPHIFNKRLQLFPIIDWGGGGAAVFQGNSVFQGGGASGLQGGFSPPGGRVREGGIFWRENIKNLCSSELRQPTAPRGFVRLTEQNFLLFSLRQLEK